MSYWIHLANGMCVCVLRGRLFASPFKYLFSCLKSISSTISLMHFKKYLNLITIAFYQRWWNDCRIFICKHSAARIISSIRTIWICFAHTHTRSRTRTHTRALFISTGNTRKQSWRCSADDDDDDDDVVVFHQLLLGVHSFYVRTILIITISLAWRCVAHKKRICAHGDSNGKKP